MNLSCYASWQLEADGFWSLLNAKKLWESTQIIFLKHQSFHQKEAIKANIYSAGKLRSAIYIGEVQKRCRALYTTWIWKRLPLLYWQATLTFGGLSTTAAFSCSFLSSSNNIGPGKTANFEYSAWLSQRTTRSRWKKTWKHSFTTWGKSHHHHNTFNTSLTLRGHKKSSTEIEGSI